MAEETYDTGMEPQFVDPNAPKQTQKVSDQQLFEQEIQQNYWKQRDEIDKNIKDGLPQGTYSVVTDLDLYNKRGINTRKKMLAFRAKEAKAIHGNKYYYQREEAKKLDNDIVTKYSADPNYTPQTDESGNVVSFQNVSNPEDVVKVDNAKLFDFHYNIAVKHATEEIDEADRLAVNSGAKLPNAVERQVALGNSIDKFMKLASDVTVDNENGILVGADGEQNELTSDVNDKQVFRPMVDAYYKVEKDRQSLETKVNDVLDVVVASDRRLMAERDENKAHAQALIDVLDPSKYVIVMHDEAGFNNPYLGIHNDTAEEEVGVDYSETEFKKKHPVLAFLRDAFRGAATMNMSADNYKSLQVEARKKEAFPVPKNAEEFFEAVRTGKIKRIEKVGQKHTDATIYSGNYKENDNGSVTVEYAPTSSEEMISMMGNIAGEMNKSRKGGTGLSASDVFFISSFRTYNDNTKKYIDSKYGDGTLESFISAKATFENEAKADAYGRLVKHYNDSVSLLYGENAFGDEYRVFQAEIENLAEDETIDTMDKALGGSYVQPGGKEDWFSIGMSDDSLRGGSPLLMDAVKNGQWYLAPLAYATDTVVNLNPFKSDTAYQTLQKKAGAIVAFETMLIKYRVDVAPSAESFNNWLKHENGGKYLQYIIQGVDFVKAKYTVPEDVKAEYAEYLRKTCGSAEEVDKRLALFNVKHLMEINDHKLSGDAEYNATSYNDISKYEKAVDRLYKIVYGDLIYSGKAQESYMYDKGLMVGNIMDITASSLMLGGMIDASVSLLSRGSGAIATATSGVKYLDKAARTAAYMRNVEKTRKTLQAIVAPTAMTAPNAFALNTARELTRAAILFNVKDLYTTEYARRRLQSETYMDEGGLYTNPDGESKGASAAYALINTGAEVLSEASSEGALWLLNKGAGKILKNHKATGLNKALRPLAKGYRRLDAWTRLMQVKHPGLSAFGHNLFLNPALETGEEIVTPAMTSWIPKIDNPNSHTGYFSDVANNFVEAYDVTSSDWWDDKLWMTATFALTPAVGLVQTGGIHLDNRIRAYKNRKLVRKIEDYLNKSTVANAINAKKDEMMAQYADEAESYGKKVSFISDEDFLSGKVSPTSHNLYGDPNVETVYINRNQFTISATDLADAYRAQFPELSGITDAMETILYGDVLLGTKAMANANGENHYWECASASLMHKLNEFTGFLRRSGVTNETLFTRAEAMKQQFAKLSERDAAMIPADTNTVIKMASSIQKLGEDAFSYMGSADGKEDATRAANGRAEKDAKKAEATPAEGDSRKVATGKSGGAVADEIARIKQGGRGKVAQPKQTVGTGNKPAVADALKTQSRDFHATADRIAKAREFIATQVKEESRAELNKELDAISSELHKVGNIADDKPSKKVTQAVARANASLAALGQKAKGATMSVFEKGREDIIREHDVDGIKENIAALKERIRDLERKKKKADKDSADFYDAEIGECQDGIDEWEAILAEMESGKTQQPAAKQQEQQTVATEQAQAVTEQHPAAKEPAPAKTAEDEIRTVLDREGVYEIPLTDILNDKTSKIQNIATLLTEFAKNIGLGRIVFCKYKEGRGDDSFKFLAFYNNAGEHIICVRTAFLEKRPADVVMSTMAHESIHYIKGLCKDKTLSEETRNYYRGLYHSMRVTLMNLMNSKDEANAAIATFIQGVYGDVVRVYGNMFAEKANTMNFKTEKEIRDYIDGKIQEEVLAHVAERITSNPDLFKRIFKIGADEYSQGNETKKKNFIAFVRDVFKTIIGKFKAAAQQAGAKGHAVDNTNELVNDLTSNVFGALDGAFDMIKAENDAKARAQAEMKAETKEETKSEQPKATEETQETTEDTPTEKKKSEPYVYNPTEEELNSNLAGFKSDLSSLEFDRKDAVERLKELKSRVKDFDGLEQERMYEAIDSLKEKIDYIDGEISDLKSRIKSINELKKEKFGKPKATEGKQKEQNSKKAQSPKTTDEAKQNQVAEFESLKKRIDTAKKTISENFSGEQLNFFNKEIEKIVADASKYESAVVEKASKKVANAIATLGRRLDILAGKVSYAMQNTGKTESTAEDIDSRRVTSVPVSEINIDPKRFQFKSKANPKTGVDESNQIGGEWDEKTAGNLYIWEDKSGKKFVVNGHHRLFLAKQIGVEKVNAIIDREVDGVTAEQAKKNGTLINIRDGQGDISDYAEFVRQEKMSEETAKKEGLLAREKGRVGFIIGHYSSDNLYYAYKNGSISEAKTAAIADVARGDETLESAGIKMANINMSASQLSEFLKYMKTVPRQQSEQGDLFGFDDSAFETGKKLSALAEKHKKEVKEKVNAAKSAIKNPNAAKKLGVNVGADAQKLLDKALLEAHRWETWYTDHEIRQQLLKEAGIKEEEETPQQQVAKQEPVKKESEPAKVTAKKNETETKYTGAVPWNERNNLDGATDLLKDRSVAMQNMDATAHAEERASVLEKARESAQANTQTEEETPMNTTEPVAESKTEETEPEQPKTEQKEQAPVQESAKEEVAEPSVEAKDYDAEKAADFDNLFFMALDQKETSKEGFLDEVNARHSFANKFISENLQRFAEREDIKKLIDEIKSFTGNEDVVRLTESRKANISRIREINKALKTESQKKAIDKLTAERDALQKQNEESGEKLKRMRSESNVSVKMKELSQKLKDSFPIGVDAKDKTMQMLETFLKSRYWFSGFFESGNRENESSSAWQRFMNGVKGGYLAVEPLKSLFRSAAQFQFLVDKHGKDWTFSNASDMVQNRIENLFRSGEKYKGDDIYDTIAKVLVSDSDKSAFSSIASLVATKLRTDISDMFNKKDGLFAREFNTVSADAIQSETAEGDSVSEIDRLTDSSDNVTNRIEKGEIQDEIDNVKLPNRLKTEIVALDYLVSRISPKTKDGNFKYHKFQAMGAEHSAEDFEDEKLFSNLDKLAAKLSAAMKSNKKDDETTRLRNIAYDAFRTMKNLIAVNDSVANGKSVVLPQMLDIAKDMREQGFTNKSEKTILDWSSRNKFHSSDKKVDAIVNYIGSYTDALRNAMNYVFRISDYNNDEYIDRNGGHDVMYKVDMEELNRSAADLIRSVKTSTRQQVNEALSIATLPARFAREGITSGENAMTEVVDLMIDDNTMYNLATEKSVADKARKWAETPEAKKLGWKPADIEKILKDTEIVWKAIHDQLTDKDYIEFSKINPEIVVDWRDGKAKPVMTWSRKNDEYKYDMSSGLLCVNNDGIEMMLSSEAMVDIMHEIARGKQDGYTSEDYLRLYSTLRDNGVIVPCKGCFDFAPRGKMLASTTQKFCNELNQYIDERNADPKKFDESVKSIDVSKQSPVNNIPTTSKTKSNMLRIAVAAEKITKHIDWTEMMSAEGQSDMVNRHPSVMRAWSRIGAGKPKDKFNPIPYDGVIIYRTNTVIAGLDEKTPDYKARYVNMGTSLRRNSHDEMRMTNWYDEFQFVRDCWIRGLMCFKYVKNPDDVRLFGKTGIKFNMSVFPAFVPGGVAAGLDENGDFAFAEESIGGREFSYMKDGAVHYDGKKGFEMMKAYQNKDVSFSTVIFSWPHMIKVFAEAATTKRNPHGWCGSGIPFHSGGATEAALETQGLGKAVALNPKGDFTESFRNFTQGVTNFEQIQNDRFNENWIFNVGDNKGKNAAGHKLEFQACKEYYNAKTGMHLHSGNYTLDSEDNKIEHKWTFDYNDECRKDGGDYCYQTVTDWCVNHLREMDLIPRFDIDVPEKYFLEWCKATKIDPKHPALGWKGEGHSWNPTDSEAYYILWCDYGMTNLVDGKYSPQRPVLEGKKTFEIPDNAADIIKAGLARESNERVSNEKRRNELLAAYMDNCVRDGALTQDQAAAISQKYGLPEDFSTMYQADMSRDFMEACESIDGEKPNYAMYIKNANGIDFNNLIATGAKVAETRTVNAWKQLQGKGLKVGDRIATINTDEHEVSGYATLGNVIGPVSYEEFHSKRYQRLHLVPVGSKFDIKPGEEKMLLLFKNQKQSKGGVVADMTGDRQGYLRMEEFTPEEFADSTMYNIMGEKGAARYYGKEEFDKRKKLFNALYKELKQKKELSAAEKRKELINIKIRTGLEKRDDGWHLFVPDGNMIEDVTIRAEDPDGEHSHMLGIGSFNHTTLGEIYDAPDLYRAYPALRDEKVFFNESKDYNAEFAQSKYNGNVHAIVISLATNENIFGARKHGEYTDITINGKTVDLNALRRLIVHEIQHYIQCVEGFYKGGDAIIASRRFAEFRTTIRSRMSKKEKEVKRIADYETKMRQMNKLDSAYRDLFGQRTNGETKYRYLAGEVDARGAEQMIGMSIEDANKMLFSDKDDIDEAFQIPTNKDETARDASEDYITNGDVAEMNYGDTGTMYSVIEDENLIRKLDGERCIIAYRAMQVGPDGKLHSPMAGKINGQWGPATELGQWEQSDEHPELVPEEGKYEGKFLLDKGNGKKIWAAYNPYFHSSFFPLNDQFEEAYKRHNIVTVEVAIPVSELDSGYHAYLAKDPVGIMYWHSGPVAKFLRGTDKERIVMLSRYCKVLRVVPDAEVAQRAKELLDGTGISVPASVVTPSLLAELKRVGVPIIENVDYSGKAPREIDGMIPHKKDLSTKEANAVREFEENLIQRKHNELSTGVVDASAIKNQEAIRKFYDAMGVAATPNLVSNGSLEEVTSAIANALNANKDLPDSMQVPARKLTHDTPVLGAPAEYVLDDAMYSADESFDPLVDKLTRKEMREAKGIEVEGEKEDVGKLESLFVPPQYLLHKNAHMARFYEAVASLQKTKSNLFMEIAQSTMDSTGTRHIDGYNNIKLLEDLKKNNPQSYDKIEKYLVAADKDNSMVCSVEEIPQEKKGKAFYFYYNLRDGLPASPEFDSKAKAAAWAQKNPMLARGTQARCRYDNDGFVLTIPKSFSVVDNDEDRIEHFNSIRKASVRAFAYENIHLVQDSGFTQEEADAVTAFRMSMFAGYEMREEVKHMIESHIIDEYGDANVLAKAAKGDVKDNFQARVFNIYNELKKMCHRVPSYFPRLRPEKAYWVTGYGYHLTKNGTPVKVKKFMYGYDKVEEAKAACMKLDRQAKSGRISKYNDIEFVVERGMNNSNERTMNMKFSDLNKMVNAAANPAQYTNLESTADFCRDHGFSAYVSRNRNGGYSVTFESLYNDVSLADDVKRFAESAGMSLSKNGKYATFDITNSFNNSEREDVQNRAINILVTAYGDSIREKTMSEHFIESLQSMTALLIETNSARNMLIERTDDYIEGFETDALSVLKMYAKALSSSYAKSEFARKTNDIITGRDLKFEDWLNERIANGERNEDDPVTGADRVAYYQAVQDRAMVEGNNDYEDIVATRDTILSNAPESLIVKVGNGVAGWVNSVATFYLLSSPSSAFINTTAGFTNVPAAAMKYIRTPGCFLRVEKNMIKYIPKYLSYCMSAFRGTLDMVDLKNNKINEHDMERLAYIRDMAYDSETQMSALVRETNRRRISQMDKFIEFFKDKVLLGTFGVTERMVRAAAILSYSDELEAEWKKDNRGKEMTIDDMHRIIDQAKDYSDRALGNFEKAHKPRVMKYRASFLLKTQFLFQTFGINMLCNSATMNDFLQTDEKAKEIGINLSKYSRQHVKATAALALSQMILGGIRATVLPVGAIAWVIKLIAEAVGDGDDDDGFVAEDDSARWCVKKLCGIKNMREYEQAEWYRKFAYKTMMDGLAGVGGIDVSGSLDSYGSIENTYNNLTSWAGFGKQVAGPGGQVATNIVEGGNLIYEGSKKISNGMDRAGWNDILIGGQKASPRLFGNLFKTAAQEVGGIYNAKGKPRDDVKLQGSGESMDKYKMYRTPTPYETMLAIFGFSPFNIAEENAEAFSRKKYNASFTEERKEISDMIDALCRSSKNAEDAMKNKTAISAIEKIRQDFNKKAEKSGGQFKAMPDDYVEKRIKSNFKEKVR